MNRFKHIDSLRGLAILMVMATHLGPALQETSTFLTAYGRMGVQLFFVVSALTLCISMQNRINEQFYIGNFFIRRYFRIAPMYILGVLIYSPLIVNYFPEIKSSVFDYLSHIFLLHGFTYNAFKTIVPGGWSIGVEFIFYLLFPIIFLFLRKESSKFKYQSLLIMFICASFVQNLYFQLYEPNYSSVWKYGYWSPINQLPVFMVGVLLYRHVCIEMLEYTLLKCTSRFIVLTFSTMVVWQLQFPFYVALVPLLSAFSFYYLYFIFKLIPWLNIRLLQRIGQLSFSMYILHFLSLMILINLNSLDFLRGLGIISFLIYFTFLTCLTMILSILTEKLIELKFVSIAKNIIIRRENTYLLSIKDNK